MRIGIIGCGNIGSRIAHRLSSDHSIFLYDRHEDRLNGIAKDVKATICENIGEVISHSDYVIVAVKPQNLGAIANQISSELKSTQLLISVLAGVSINTLKQHFGKVPILRMMPNLAMLYGEGVIGLAENPDLSQEMKKDIEEIFAPLGALYWLPDEKMDALASLTGSGPAFTFVIIESMIEAALAMGFQAKQAQELVLQMILGSVTMLRESGMHLGKLKWQVTSPGGTTIAGLHKMEEEKVRSGIIKTFMAAYQKAKELS